MNIVSEEIWFAHQSGLQLGRKEVILGKLNFFKREYENKRSWRQNGKRRHLWRNAISLKSWYRNYKLGNQSSNSYFLLVSICCHLSYHPCPDKMPGICPVTLIFHFIWYFTLYRSFSVLNKAELKHEREYFIKNFSFWVLACRASKTACHTRWNFKANSPNIDTQKQVNKSG